MSENTVKSAPFVELKFGPKWTYVSTVRSFMQNFLAVTFENKIKADKISMAVSELVENAVKYSEQEDAFIRLRILNEGHMVEVLVVNHCTEDQANIVTEFIREINSMPPLEAYMEMMRRSVNSPNKSQLGLARIRYEAEGSLDVNYAYDRISVKAVFNI